MKELNTSQKKVDKMGNELKIKKEIHPLNNSLKRIARHVSNATTHENENYFSYIRNEMVSVFFFMGIEQDDEGDFVYKSKPTKLRSVKMKHQKINQAVIERTAKECHWESLSEDERKSQIAEVKKYIANPNTKEISESDQYFCTITIGRYWNMGNNLEAMNKAVLNQYLQPEHDA